MSNDPFVTITGGTETPDIVFETSFGFGTDSPLDCTRPNGELVCEAEPDETTRTLAEQLLAAEGIERVTLAPGEVRIVRADSSDKDELTWNAVAALGAYCKEVRRQNPPKQ